MVVVMKFGMRNLVRKLGFSAEPVNGSTTSANGRRRTRPGPVILNRERRMLRMTVK